MDIILFKLNTFDLIEDVINVIKNIYISSLIVTCQRKDVVASFVGHTPYKTIDFLKEHKGCIINIDFCCEIGDSFGVEAVDTLLKYYDKYKVVLCVIQIGKVYLKIDKIKTWVIFEDDMF
jgi:hypothetical protein